MRNVYIWPFRDLPSFSPFDSNCNIHLLWLDQSNVFATKFWTFGNDCSLACYGNEARSISQECVWVHLVFDSLHLVCHSFSFPSGLLVGRLVKPMNEWTHMGTSCLAIICHLCPLSHCVCWPPVVWTLKKGSTPLPIPFVRTNMHCTWISSMQLLVKCVFQSITMLANLCLIGTISCWPICRLYSFFFVLFYHFNRIDVNNTIWWQLYGCCLNFFSIC